ncbi:MAG: type II toxin-antitoxin system prevent-host-death family antitoxin [Rhodocyclaceae bacterium]|nr:type II toxin-antitoxin system prevent-host-death family antitoxin [Rhodocyclaceae bacterium]MBX3669918.1 type II toxin-antitoxin system prevent-host-death family antitoxin [Rhodocyclaceae bacterium]
MIREAPAVKVRQNLGEMLNEVRYKRDSIVICKDGVRVAALVDIGLFERICEMEERFARLTDNIRAGLANLSDAELESALLEGLDAARAAQDSEAGNM